jgi:hypothetical protein
MHHDLYPSLDAMLTPESLSVLSRERITDARRVPIDALEESASGNPIVGVRTNAGGGPRYVVKCISPTWDWIMRASGDTGCREVQLWQHGILDALPSETTHPVIACAKDGEGWAILMRDISPVLLSPLPETVAGSDIEAILDGMAALHAHFWQQPCLQEPGLGLCRPEAFFTCLGPEVGYGPDLHPDELAQQDDAGAEPRFSRVVLRLIGDGWRRLESLVTPDVAAVARELLADPRPLCRALARYPSTLVHGDMKPANLGLERDAGSRLHLLDWQLTMRGQPAIDLAWFLDCFTLALPYEKGVAIEQYRLALARRLGDRFRDDWWRPQLALGLLGEFLRQGWFMLNDAAGAATARERDHALQDLTWWSDRVREGVQWL